ncbi:sensor histidine kinase [Spirosoma taeanense]|nr:7TM diverse intracellular signaling domain-containing protein [Spirosoma taeanense]
MYLSTLFVYKQHDQLAVLLWGIYYGLLLTGFLYHLLLWMFTRQTAYAYLSLYLATYFLFEINRGLSPAQQYLWPGLRWLIQNGLNLFFTVTLLAFVNFYSYVFGFRLESKRAKISTALIAGYIICLWLLLFFVPGLSRNFIAICQFLPTAGFLVVVGFRKLRAGHIYTHFYLYSLICFIGGGVLFSINRAGILPGDDFAVHYTGNLGSILEIILMSFGVAFALRQEQRNTIYFSEKARTAFTEGRAEELNLVALRLHHEAGNNLLLLLKTIERLSPDQPISGQTIKMLYSQAFDSYSMVRNWAYSATPETLLNQGLAIALQKLIDRANQTETVSFLLLITGDEDKLPLKVQFELYYVCVELVNNIIKHAQATEASLYVCIQQNLVITECRDDGIGFIQPVGSSAGGMGLDTIRKRLTRIGGTYETHRLRDRGMKVVVQIPLSDQPILTGK